MFRRRTITTAPRYLEAKASPGGILGRLTLSLAAAGAFIAGAFLPWFRPLAMSGTRLSVRVFVSSGPDVLRAPFDRSAGAVAILIGLVALMGLAFRSGWVLRLAGVAGLVAFGLYVLTLVRAPGEGSAIGAIGIGAWGLLLGGVLALGAGLAPVTRSRSPFPTRTSRPPRRSQSRQAASAFAENAR